MQKITAELTSIVRETVGKLRAIPEPAFYHKPDASKWSKIEILGHLIDSAQNNLRRFICVQYEPEIPWIVYQQDAWVTANAYQTAKLDDLIRLWWLMNERVIAVLIGMNEKYYGKLINTGKDATQYYSILALAEDYIRHMKHHLGQIISSEHPQPRID